MAFLAQVELRNLRCPIGDACSVTMSMKMLHDDSDVELRYLCKNPQRQQTEKSEGDGQDPVAIQQATTPNLEQAEEGTDAIAVRSGKTIHKTTQTTHKGAGRQRRTAPRKNPQGCDHTIPGTGRGRSKTLNQKKGTAKISDDKAQSNGKKRKLDRQDLANDSSCMTETQPTMDEADKKNNKDKKDKKDEKDKSEKNEKKGKKDKSEKNEKKDKKDKSEKKEKKDQKDKSDKTKKKDQPNKRGKKDVKDNAQKGSPNKKFPHDTKDAMITNTVAKPANTQEGIDVRPGNTEQCTDPIASEQCEEAAFWSSASAEPVSQTPAEPEQHVWSQPLTNAQQEEECKHEKLRQELAHHTGEQRSSTTSSVPVFFSVRSGWPSGSSRPPIRLPQMDTNHQTQAVTVSAPASPCPQSPNSISDLEPTSPNESGKQDCTTEATLIALAPMDSSYSCSRCSYHFRANSGDVDLGLGVCPQCDMSITQLDAVEIPHTSIPKTVQHSIVAAVTPPHRDCAFRVGECGTSPIFPVRRCE